LLFGGLAIAIVVEIKNKKMISVFFTNSRLLPVCQMHCGALPLITISEKSILE
tara:strand:- start:349 stop:507 length:159 start_codon:yes stop_codon:yes gene_type:complete